MSISVYLCGFMGCGKSHIGRILSEKTQMPLIDLDTYIVDAENMTIPQIFEKFGELYFRELEAKYIRELSFGNIVATGGGALINESTAEFAKQSGMSVFINTSFENCYARINDDENRPLVMKNTEQQLKMLYDTRFPIYKKHSSYTVNGDSKDTIIADEIIKLLKFHENRKGD